MADLFSREYLNDLLESGRFGNAAKKAAKAGLDAAGERLADEDGLGLSYADRILNGGDGLVRDIAQEVLSQASQSLDSTDQGSTAPMGTTGASEGAGGSSAAQGMGIHPGFIEGPYLTARDARAMAGSSGDGTGATGSPSASRNGLFSQEYLKGLLDPDFAGKADAAIKRGVEGKADALVGALAEKTDHNPLVGRAAEAAKDKALGKIPSVRKAKDRFSGTSNAPPRGLPLTGAGKAAGDLGAAAKSTRKTNKGCLRAFVIAMILLLAPLFFGLVFSANGMSSCSPDRSAPTLIGTEQLDIERVVAYGVTNSDNRAEFISIADEARLKDPRDNKIDPAKTFAGLTGQLCAVIEDENGVCWLFSGDELLFSRKVPGDVLLNQYGYRNNESYFTSSRAILPLSEYRVWFPEAREIPEPHKYGTVALLAQGWTIDVSAVRNNDPTNHVRICNNAVLILQQDSATETLGYPVYSVVAYCADDGGVRYDSSHEAGYDVLDKVLYLPAEMAPAKADQAAKAGSAG
ncbi:MAG: hypothetical protein LBG81_03405 [Coriobacteriaceae bacterium]|jgi:hypothetical protein|nr:hypothetical protein [Coriobacteriaceae bacterium]